MNLVMKACRFLILFVLYDSNWFSLKQNRFFEEHKLLPILQIWLHLVYGKMFSLQRHLMLMVSKEKFSLQYVF